MPVKKRLTDELVADLQVRKKRYLVWDTVVPGLAVRVGTSRKTFVLVARFSSHTSRRSLGTVGKITVDVARQRAQRLHTQLQGEVDTTLTFGEVANKFYQHIERLKRWDEVVRMIERECKAWMQKPLMSITKKDVIALLERKRDTPSAGHHLLANIRRVFSYAIARDLIEHSPTDRIDARQLLGAKQIRTRVLTDDELRRVWQAAYQLSPEYRDAVHLLMLTGARKNEVAHAKRSEFHLMGRTWTLPSDRTKQAAAHIIPITRSMMLILDPYFEGEREGHLFGRPLNGWSKVKRRLDKAIGEGMAHFTIHDIRRTFRTRLAALGISDAVAEVCIGHAKKGLLRVYQQYQYEREVRDAFNAWGNALEAIVQAPSTPIPGTSLQGEGDLAPVPPAKALLAAS